MRSTTVTSTLRPAAQSRSSTASVATSQTGAVHSGGLPPNPAKS